MLILLKHRIHHAHRLSCSSSMGRSQKVWMAPYYSILLPLTAANSCPIHASSTPAYTRDTIRLRTSRYKVLLVWRCRSRTDTTQKYQVYRDAYNGVLRLDLYRFDGSPMNPMYIAYTPPVMLPTQIMNPTATASVTGTLKRSFMDEELDVPLNKNAKHLKRDTNWKFLDTTLMWWTGVGITVFGGAAYLL
jgi:hypothetical protein